MDVPPSTECDSEDGEGKKKFCARDIFSDIGTLCVRERDRERESARARRYTHTYEFVSGLMGLVSGLGARADTHTHTI